MNSVSLMEQNIFLQECFKIILYLHQRKQNAVNISGALLGLIRRNLMEFQKKMLKILKI